MSTKNQSILRLLTVGFGLFLHLTTSAQDGAIPAGAVHAKVIQTTPILVRERLPHEECVALPQERQQCRTTYRVHERTQGYEVTYLYQGRQYTTEMAYDPGATVLILPPRAQNSYSSQSDPENASVQPGRKSYGSAPVGDSTLSIEYRDPQPDIPIVLDLHAPLNARPGQPHRRPTPAAPPGQRPGHPAGQPPGVPGH